eukprot:SM000051S17629  [mRNA]  locus=s51:653850:657503:- [translate_table: standard]
MASNGCYVCAALTAASVEAMAAGMEAAASAGAGVAELRLDHIVDFHAPTQLKALLDARCLPVIVTYRPTWEGGQYSGPEEARLEALLQAVDLGADFVDVELQARVASSFVQRARDMMAARPATSPATRIIVSSHNYEATPDDEGLARLVADIQATGANIVKLATTAVDITDNARIFSLLGRTQVPMIALVMGPRGQISRFLAPKFGAFLTFAALDAGKESAPGQSTVSELSSVYRLSRVGRDTKVLGLIGNPVSHSKGPVLHNAAMASAGYDGVYVPFLVDSVTSFLKTFNSPDFTGFSVTIPHKLAALQACDEVDPVAKAIGAVNTIVRRPEDGKLVGYNTDWEAAICAIEDGLRAAEGLTAGITSSTNRGEKHSPLRDRLVVVVGAGGAGKALVFGARQRGARVLIANRSRLKAEELAMEAGASVVNLVGLSEPGIAELAAGESLMPVLANTTSIGMHPNVDESPVAAEGLRGYRVVFDAVYTPMETMLLRDAKQMGCHPVSGLEMFVGQAAEQFELFTGRPGAYI